MIRNKKLGLKIAEDEDEAYWTEMKERMEKEIKLAGKAIIVNQAVLELAMSKLDEKAKGDL